MRMRKLKHLEERQARCPGLWMTDPAAMRGNWRSLQPEAGALWLEIGCGKGKFTAELAQAHPEVLLLAMERVPEAHVMAMERARDMGVTNARYLIEDADQLDRCFAPGELDRIYLNFSDPWPANRHARRRLTHRDFLERYARALAPGGRLCIKTDNQGLFDFTLYELEMTGWEVYDVTRDLHQNGPVGIMTGYEEKFVAQGVPICRLEAAYRGGTV